MRRLRRTKTVHVLTLLSVESLVRLPVRRIVSLLRPWERTYEIAQDDRSHQNPLSALPATSKAETRL